MRREFLQPNEQETILQMGLENKPTVLRSGLRTKTKFNFDRIPDESPEFATIVDGLQRLIKDRMSRPEAIVSVADGATRLGEALAEQLHLPHCESHKDDSNIGFHVTAEFERRQTRTVLIDDVYTAGTNLNAVARASYVAGLFVIGAAVIVDRSDDPWPSIMAPDNIRYDVHSLIKHPIPTY